MSDRHLEPTPQRKQQARKEGRFPRSRDLSGIAVLVVGVYLLWTFGAEVFQELSSLTSAQLRTLTVNLDEIDTQFERLALRLAVTRWLPFAGLLMAIAIASQLGQGGPVWLPQRVLPRASRLRPRQGNPVPMGLALVVKVAAFVALTALAFKGQILSLSAHGDQVFETGYVTRSWAMAGLCLLGGGFVVAVVDYLWSIWRYEQSVKMTPEEMREEMRGRSGGVRVQQTLPTHQHNPK